MTVQSIESFFLSQRHDKHSKFRFMLFVWNGKQASPLVKALALTKGFELDSLISQAQDPLLQVLFSGGVIRGKKLQRGSVLVFENAQTSQEEHLKVNPNAPFAETTTVYLLEWLFPPHVLQQFKAKDQQQNKRASADLYPKFAHAIREEAKDEESFDHNTRVKAYTSRFQLVDDIAPKYGLSPIEAVVRRAPQSMGIPLDLSGVCREDSNEGEGEDENQQDSQREFSQPKQPKGGIGLDLTKAKNIQQEILDNPGTQQKKGLPTFGKEAGEGEGASKGPIEGLQLKINIANVAQTRESEAKEEEEEHAGATQAPGRARRGGAPLMKKGKSRSRDALQSWGWTSI